MPLFMEPLLLMIPPDLYQVIKVQKSLLHLMMITYYHLSPDDP